MGSVGITSNTSSSADYSQGYTNAGRTLREQYINSQELRDAGFVPLNDWNLSSLLKESNDIAEDYQPWNNKTVYFVWDPDFKTWQRAAERRY